MTDKTEAVITPILEMITNELKALEIEPVSCEPYEHPTVNKKMYKVTSADGRVALLGAKLSIYGITVRA